MNRHTVDEWIPKAIKVLEELEIAKSGAVVKTYRSAISSFGAAITMGSLKSAVAFFSDKGDSTIDRNKLIEAMYYIIHGESKTAKIICAEIIEITDEHKLNKEREDFINASIALKLAMNAFELVDKENKKD